MSFNLAIEMLIISGHKGGFYVHRTVEQFQSRNRDAYHFRRVLTTSPSTNRMVSISQSRCLSFQDALSVCGVMSAIDVSISQSRCLSFQGRIYAARQAGEVRFNLAIEMLIISGHATEDKRKPSQQFQSRNRDAYHFRQDREARPNRHARGFNLAIEMLIISGCDRNADPNARKRGFNLAIEMLIISGRRRPVGRISP